METEKKCTKCYEVKPLESFSISRNGYLGRYSVCKSCKVSYMINRYKTDSDYRAKCDARNKTENRRAKDRDRQREKKKDPSYRQKISEYQKEYMKTYDWRGKRLESRLDPIKKTIEIQKNKQYYKEMMGDPERRKAHKEWLDAYRKTDKYKEYKRQNYHRRVAKKDQSFFIILSLRNRMNKVISGGVKAGNAKALLGCSLDEFKIHLESLFTDGMTWDNRGKNGWHIDHIVPCAHFDMSDPMNQKICFHYLNLQPLWFRDNCSKQDTLPDDYESVIQKIREAIKDLP